MNVIIRPYEPSDLYVSLCANIGNEIVGIYLLRKLHPGKVSHIA